MSYGNGRISSSPGPRSSYHAIMPQTKNKKRFPLPPPRLDTHKRSSLPSPLAPIRPEPPLGGWRHHKSPIKKLPHQTGCIHTFLHHSFKHSDPFRAYAFHEIGRIRNTRRFVLEIMPQIGDNHSPWLLSRLVASR